MCGVWCLVGRISLLELIPMHFVLHSLSLFLHSCDLNIASRFCGNILNEGDISYEIVWKQIFCEIWWSRKIGFRVLIFSMLAAHRFSLTKLNADFHKGISSLIIYLIAMKEITTFSERTASRYDYKQSYERVYWCDWIFSYKKWHLQFFAYFNSIRRIFEYWCETTMFFSSLCHSFHHLPRVLTALFFGALQFCQFNRISFGLNTQRSAKIRKQNVSVFIRSIECRSIDFKMWTRNSFIVGAHEKHLRSMWHGDNVHVHQSFESKVNLHRRYL